MPKVKSKFSVSQTSNLNVMYNDLPTGYYKYKIEDCDRSFIEKFVKVEEEYSYLTEIVYYVDNIKLRKIKLEILKDLGSRRSEVLKKLIRDSQSIGMEELLSLSLSKEIDKEILKKLTSLRLDENENYDEYH